MNSRSRGSEHPVSQLSVVRECKAYMEKQGKSYSAAEWLFFIKPQLSHTVYKKLRYTQYRIALTIVVDEVPKELFYLSIQSDFDRIPSWAQHSVSGL